MKSQNSNTKQDLQTQVQWRSRRQEEQEKGLYRTTRPLTQPIERREESTRQVTHTYLFRQEDSFLIYTMLPPIEFAQPVIPTIPLFNISHEHSTYQKLLLCPYICRRSQGVTYPPSNFAIRLNHPTLHVMIASRYILRMFLHFRGFGMG